MTSFPQNADELVSAYLDGEAAPDEIAIVEGNEELLAQVAAMRATAELMNTTPPPVTDQRELHLSAALGAFDALMAASAETSGTDTGNIDTSNAVPEPPVLTSVPSGEPIAHSSAAATSPSQPEQGTKNEEVSSLAAARERRKKRRTGGLIAAAAAVMLLFVGVILNSGNGRDSLEVADNADTAVEAPDVAGAAAPEGESSSRTTTGLSDAADFDSDEAMDDSANDDAMEESMSAAPPEAAAMDEEQEDAMDEEAMDDSADEAAMDDAGSGDAESDEGAAAEPAATVVPLPTAPEPGELFNFGTYPEEQALSYQLQQYTNTDDGRNRADAVGQGLFPRCQDEIPELGGVDTPTLIGEAIVAGEPVEIHRLPNETEGSTLYVLRPSSCEIVTIVTPSG